MKRWLPLAIVVVIVVAAIAIDFEIAIDREAISLGGTFPKRWFPFESVSSGGAPVMNPFCFCVANRIIYRNTPVFVACLATLLSYVERKRGRLSRHHHLCFLELARASHVGGQRGVVII